jgi:hypothetical protein
MSIRRASFGFVLAGMFAASLSLAAPADSSAGARPLASSGGNDPQLAQALQKSVSHHVAESGLQSSLRGYFLSPSLIQLRRYVDPGQSRSKFVCVVGLSLQTDQREVVAEIRGNAATLGTSQLEAIDAAAHSAVLRVADVLAKVQARETSRTAQR